MELTLLKHLKKITEFKHEFKWANTKQKIRRKRKTENK
jgi:hypothetical protein